MAIFYLKARDTRPIIEVTLLQPDGSVYDLTGVSSVYLHILMNDQTELRRAMVIDVDPTTGKASYTWLSTDWGTSSVVGSGTDNDPYTVGGLFAGPTPPLSTSDVEHRMEYEVVSGSLRLTFPNDSYDTLRIVDDIGQGS